MACSSVEISLDARPPFAVVRSLRGIKADKRGSLVDRPRAYFTAFHDLFLPDGAIQFVSSSRLSAVRLELSAVSRFPVETLFFSNGLYSAERFSE